MSTRSMEPEEVVETVDNVVTFPRGGPYARTYTVDGNGRVYRGDETTSIDRIILQVKASDATPGIKVQLEFVSRTTAKLSDGFEKTGGSCRDNDPVDTASTITVGFAVPAQSSTETCEWTGTTLVVEPFVQVVVQTKRV